MGIEEISRFQLTVRVVMGKISPLCVTKHQMHIHMKFDTSCINREYYTPLAHEMSNTIGPANRCYSIGTGNRVRIGTRRSIIAPLRLHEADMESICLLINGVAQSEKALFVDVIIVLAFSYLAAMKREYILHSERLCHR